MTTPISASSRAMSNASFNSLTVSGRKALRISGRLMVILATPSEVRWYLMSLNLRIVVHIQESPQLLNESRWLLPRDAMTCARADPQSRVRQLLHRALSGLDVF